MHGDAAKIRVNLWLRRRIFCKSVPFFAFLFFFTLSVKDGNAAMGRMPENHKTATLTITATVPLSAEFLFAVKQYSSVTAQQDSLMVGEETTLLITLTNGEQKLSGQRIRVAFVGHNNQERAVFFGNTDARGKAIIPVRAEKNLLGKNIVKVTSLAYKNPVELVSQPTVIVYEIEKEAQKSEKKGKKITAHITASVSTVEGKNEDGQNRFLRNSGTIIIRTAIQQLPRAGPRSA